MRFNDICSLRLKSAIIIHALQWTANISSVFDWKTNKKQHISHSLQHTKEIKDESNTSTDNHTFYARKNENRIVRFASYVICVKRRKNRNKSTHNFWTQRNKYYPISHTHTPYANPSCKRCNCIKCNKYNAKWTLK